MAEEIIDLTFIAVEQRRIEVAPDIYLVKDGQDNDGVHWRFDHLCKVVDGQRLRIAPYLQEGHLITAEDTPQITVNPSILCSDCGTHGFVREGRWDGV
jgi:hypothetical protein